MREAIHLFHMPELNDHFSPCLFDYIKEGNLEIKTLSCECLVLMIKYQYNSSKRQELVA